MQSALWYYLPFILFMSGLKDDLMGTSARTKLLVQIGTAVLVLLNSELTVTHLSGFFGIGEVTPVVGFLISLSFIVFLVNAYNLIDGIDGLAGIIAIVAFSVFGVYYYVNDNVFLSVIMVCHDWSADKLFDLEFCCILNARCLWEIPDRSLLDLF